jgi:hypothetical protein
MKKVVLALGLVLLPASVQPTPAAPFSLFHSLPPVLSGKLEARLEQQKSKWAPNGMKMLILHGKRRLVERPCPPPLEKRKNVPIPKEGV